jgi:hypothetical protein
LASLGERWRILAPYADLTPRSYRAVFRLKSGFRRCWTFLGHFVAQLANGAPPDDPRLASQAAEVTCHGDAHADLSRPDLASGFEEIMGKLARARREQRSRLPRRARFALEREGSVVRTTERLGAVDGATVVLPTAAARWSLGRWPDDAGSRPACDPAAIPATGEGSGLLQL